jgi:hypothetical protein
VSVLSGVLVGLGAAVPTILVGALLPLNAALAFVAVLLGVTAGVYLGFAVGTGDVSTVLAEGLGVAVFPQPRTARRGGAGLVLGGVVGYDVALGAFILIRFG